MTRQPILEAKLKLAALRSEFEIQKEREWVDIQARARTELENAVWAAKEAGRTISDIAREYGTTNRHTIYDILKQVSDTPTTQREPYTVTRTDTSNYYQVTDGTHTVFVWGGDDAVAPYKYARALDTDSATALGWPMSKDPTHPAWAYVRELEAEGK